MFWVSVPIGILGTIWSYRSLHELGDRQPRARIDWPGNLTFAVGLTALLAAITYGIQPYGGHPTGWTNPWVLAGLIGGIALLVAVRASSRPRVADPMFHLRLFRIRAFAPGNLAGLLASIGRGGLQFMLIIWLQGIWLPLHGYDYESTPLWAGIYLLPLTVGFLVAGPAVAATCPTGSAPRASPPAACSWSALTFVGLMLLPTDFTYWLFAAAHLRSTASARACSPRPNTTPIMNCVPADQRGAASGMRGTFFNSGSSLSIGIFFSLMIAGLAPTLPTTLTRRAHRSRASPPGWRSRSAGCPPVGSLFAAFLGYNPMQSLLGPTGVLDRLPAGQRGDAHRQGVLPAADLRAVPPRPGHRVHRRGRADDAGRRVRRRCSGGGSPVEREQPALAPVAKGAAPLAAEG